MDMKKEFSRIMASQTEIALATSINNIPNIRIINFYYDEIANILFFTTFSDNEKIKDFQQNNKIAFTTIAHQGTEHIKAKGTVKTSALTIYDLREKFATKMPDYDNTIEQAGDSLLLFEIHFDTAIVTLDFDNIGILSI